MIIKRYSAEEFKIQKLSSSEYLFNTIPFLQNIATCYKKELSIYTVIDKNTALLSLPVLHNGRNAKLCTHFFYQAIIIHHEFSDRKFVEIWESLINRLKKDFDAFDFKLAPYAKDIRPFTWAGIGHQVYYTANINLLQETGYSQNIKRSIKKGLNASLSVNALNFDEEIIDEQCADMQKNGLSTKESHILKKWLKNCADTENLIVFEMLNADKQRIASSIYLMDKQQAYLLSVMGGEEGTGGQAYLYDQAFAHLKSKGIAKIDLLGANIPNIALYKSKLGAETESYVIVSYRKYYKTAFIGQLLKQTLKKLLKSIRIINK